MQAQRIVLQSDACAGKKRSLCNSKCHGNLPYSNKWKQVYCALNNKLCEPLRCDVVSSGIQIHISSMTSSVECQKKSISQQETCRIRRRESQQIVTPHLVWCFDSQLSSGWDLITYINQVLWHSRGRFRDVPLHDSKPNEYFSPCHTVWLFIFVTCNILMPWFSLYPSKRQEISKNINTPLHLYFLSLDYNTNGIMYHGMSVYPISLK